MRFLRHFLSGSVRVRMTGGSPERFFNLCKNAGIEIRGISVRDGEYRFSVFLPDFRRVRPSVRKAGVHLSVTARCGLKSFLFRNRKRKPFAAGAAAFFVILFLLSRFLWNIEIQGNAAVSDDTLLRWLAARGIACGTPAARVDGQALEEALRGDFPEIRWISVHVSGTRLFLSIREETVPVEEVSPEEPADLIADRDGVITAIVVRSGIPRVKEGDEVKRGDVLVSGELPVTGDFDELLGTRRVRADADVAARSERTVRQQLPGRVTERVFTGRSRFGAELRAGGLVFVWMLPSDGKNPWRIVCEKRQAALFADFYLPVWTGRIRADEYLCYERSVRDLEITAAKEREVRRTAENFSRKGLSILQNDVTILEKGGGYEVEERLTLSGPIAAARALSEETAEVKGVEATE